MFAYIYYEFISLMRGVQNILPLMFRLRECREDLVVDLAEILFNELAFFRLMQGLEPNSMMKSNAKQWRQVRYYRF